MEAIIKHYRTIKKAIKKSDLANPFMAGKYAFSPYMACQHGCIYCDGRAEKYYVEGDFDRDIVIRKNLPDILREELPKLREKGTIAIGSGISDAYQPIEKEEKLMRACAAIIADQGFPVSIMTKSSLILRDIDLWEKINERAGLCITVSLTFLDDELREIFEPGASPVSERLAVLETCKKKGIHTGVTAMPFLPFISDTRENLDRLFSRLYELGVDYILPGGLTLRPGRQKDLFLGVIKSRFPGLLHNYEKLYSENRPSGSPVSAASKDFFRRVMAVLSRYPIPLNIPHSIYKKTLPSYDSVYILLCHLMELYSHRGIDTKPLYAGLKRYSQWLLEEKKVFNRKRSLTGEYLEDKFKTLLKSGEIFSVFRNEKLAGFISSLVLEDKTFDYVDLKAR